MSVWTKHKYALLYQYATASGAIHGNEKPTRIVRLASSRQSEKISRQRWVSAFNDVLYHEKPFSVVFVRDSKRNPRREMKFGVSLAQDRRLASARRKRERRMHRRVRAGLEKFRLGSLWRQCIEIAKRYPERSQVV